MPPTSIDTTEGLFSCSPSGLNVASIPDAFQKSVDVVIRWSWGALTKISIEKNSPLSSSTSSTRRPTSSERKYTGAPIPSIPASSERRRKNDPSSSDATSGGFGAPTNDRSGGPARDGSIPMYAPPRSVPRPLTSPAETRAVTTQKFVSLVRYGSIHFASDAVASTFDRSSLKPIDSTTPTSTSR